MNPHFKDNERELVKLVNHFRKRAEKLVKEGKLSEEHLQVSEACERLVIKLDMHAQGRGKIMEQREALGKIVKDNAVCPECKKDDKLKHISVVTHEKGWKNNRYKCRSCNIEFTWNRPNNPWDMIKFLESVIGDLKSNLHQMSEEARTQSQSLIEQMEEGLGKLKPVIEGADREFEEFLQRDKEMTKLINDFKNYLLIEKIKMDSWNNEVGES